MYSKVTKLYKFCIVPQCKSTSTITPNKLFIVVPRQVEMRKRWLKLAQVNPEQCLVRRVYFCEDHFDLPNDMINYKEYYIKGSVSSRIQLKPGVAPSNFDCQLARKKLMSTSPTNVEEGKMAIEDASERNNTQERYVNMLNLGTHNLAVVDVQTISNRDYLNLGSGPLTVAVKEEVSVETKEEILNNNDNSNNDIISVTFKEEKVEALSDYSNNISSSLTVKQEVSVKKETISGNYEFIDIKSAFVDDTITKNEKSNKKKSNYNKIISCNWCMKQFTSNDYLTHADKCKNLHNTSNKCNKKLTMPSVLKKNKHYIVEKPYDCNSCNEVFIDLDTLKIHKQVHYGEKPYPCKICDKAYRFNKSLIKHMNQMHSGIKPYIYACKECDDTFAELDALKRHIRKHIVHRCILAKYAAKHKSNTNQN